MARSTFKIYVINKTYASTVHCKCVIQWYLHYDIIILLQLTWAVAWTFHAWKWNFHAWKWNLWCLHETFREGTKPSIVYRVNSTGPWTLAPMGGAIYDGAGVNGRKKLFLWKTTEKGFIAVFPKTVKKSAVFRKTGEFKKSFLSFSRKKPKLVFCRSHLHHRSALSLLFNPPAKQRHSFSKPADHKIKPRNDCLSPSIGSDSKRNEHRPWFESLLGCLWWQA